MTTLCANPDPNPNRNAHAVEQALLRYRVLNFIEDLVAGGCSLARAFRRASQRLWPDENGDYYQPRTLEDWWYTYRRQGFAGLQPKPRRDLGQSRTLTPELGHWLEQQVTQHPHIPLKVCYPQWLAQGQPLPSLSVIYRYLRRRGCDRATLLAGPPDTGPTKAFEAPAVNDLWMVDFSPGPKLVRPDGTAVSTHLCVIVDDYSRLIPYGAYYERANTETFLHTFQQAIQRRGLPRKLYTDHGAPFINQHTRVVCATLGVRLLHAKPYHSWSKGKVERLIQTIQQGFESTLATLQPPVQTLADLNSHFSRWVQTVYHQRPHSATGQSPEARYQPAAATLRQVAADVEVEVLFYTHLERTVRKDGTIRLDGQLYEVDLSLRALVIQLRFNPFTRTRLEVWHQGKFLGLARKANRQLNHETGGGQAYAR